MHVLVLGGTRFLGRAAVDAALGRGDEVTLFNRGQSNPGLYPGLETIIGDRAGDLSALAARGWDAVIDIAGYDPEVVRNSARAIDAGRYVFVSTASVYASHDVTQTEDSPVLSLTGDLPEADRYGARKAEAEQIVTSIYGSNAHIARAGLIVGPHDPTDRFAYWPRRIARGGRVLAPGDPADPLQFIDVRDLAAWLVDACHRDGRQGTFNVTGKPMPFKHLLDRCVNVTGSDADLTWVPTDVLLVRGADPWMGVPMWIAAAPGWAAANDVDVSRAMAAGLVIRPLEDTIRDTLAWDRARGGPAREGLSAEDEARLLS
jgi:2'-hydroxyisoflavone reductase